MRKEQTLTNWIDEYGQRLTRLAFSCVHDWAAAQDRVQDAFIKAYRSMEQLTNEERPFPWLAKIVINECKASARTSWREVLTFYFPERAGSDTSLDDGYLKKEYYQTLHDAVLHLPPHYSAPVVLHYFEELSIEDISKILGIRPGTVKSRLARGREQLKNRMKEAMQHERTGSQTC
ncbi:RNA polymerase sigma factor [Cohnella suwonensis]|uniref:RNA polymerase sigma factor n=1 Tax=Cohnella suwonensis TaxID=696072 RepID=A0ABW0M0M1_9BACL